MTAIKTVVDGNGTRAPVKRGLATSDGSCRSLTAAKAHFLDSVGEGVDVLMRRCGYSRERATNTLLRELSRGEITLSDNEVFHMMKTQGVGMEDARKALTVSKTVLKVMREKGSSAVQAIDDLTSRMNIVSLLMGKSTLETDSTEEIKPENQRQRQQSKTRPVNSQPDRQQKKLSTSGRKASAKQKLPKLTGEVKGSKQSVIVKNSRKRSASGNEEIGKDSRKARTRADSVTEQVNAKMAKSCESNATETLPPRAKRQHDSPAVATQPVLKRARAGER